MIAVCIAVVAAVTFLGKEGPQTLAQVCTFLVDGPHAIVADPKTFAQLNVTDPTSVVSPYASVT